MRRLAFIRMRQLLATVVRRVKVEGPSMLPTYVAGEVLTGIRKWRRVRVGDVVVLRDPRDASRWLLKRCVAREGPMLDVRGDNEQASTDSRDFGLVESKNVRYLVLQHQK
ncbi:MAG: S26 family signal peptidase [Acidimicrobiaceae bacterium]|nr:S26 family signal peptidase [Acidimicrobiaceae bacterium]